MKFSLAQQNLEAGSPWPVSSANCTGAQKLDPTTEGLIGVGAILGMVILVLSIYALYQCCWKPQRTHKETQDTSNASNPPPKTVEPEESVAAIVSTKQSVLDNVEPDVIGTVETPALPGPKSLRSGPLSARRGGRRGMWA